MKISNAPSACSASSTTYPTATDSRRRDSRSPNRRPKPPRTPATRTIPFAYRPAPTRPRPPITPPPPAPESRLSPPPVHPRVHRRPAQKTAPAGRPAIPALPGGHTARIRRTRRPPMVAMAGYRPRGISSGDHHPGSLADPGRALRGRAGSVPHGGFGDAPGRSGATLTATACARCTYTQYLHAVPNRLLPPASSRRCAGTPRDYSDGEIGRGRPWQRQLPR